MKQAVLNAASTLGLGKHAVKLYHSLSGMQGLDFEVDPEVRNYQMEHEDGKILLPLVRGQWGTVSFTHCVLAHAFRTRGYSPRVLLCDEDLSICNRKSPGSESSSVCAMCNVYGKELLDKFGLQPLDLSDYYGEPVVEETDLDVDEYRSIPVSDYALASSRKFLRKYNVDLNDEYERDVYKRFLESAVRHVEICENVIEDGEIEAVVASDSMYNESGVYLNVANKHDIPAHSTGLGYRDGYLVFGNQRNRVPQPQFTDPSTVRKYIEEPLSQSQKSEIERIMEERASGDASRVPYNETGSSNRFSGEDPTVGMFTNLIWDGSLEIEEAPFPDVFDWIYGTIDHFIDSEMNLVVRTHPVEAIRETNEGVAESINDRYDSLPDNIHIVEPEAEVDTYSLMEGLEAGIVYNSTVGLEMAYNGLPVVVAGDTHYRNLGITYDPETPAEYYEILEGIGNLRAKEDTAELAKRYAHFLMVRKHIPFDLVSMDESASGELTSVSHDGIKPGNPNFDTIVEKILSDEPVLSD